LHFLEHGSYAIVALALTRVVIVPMDEMDD
jgi:hypothetical protein